jgi:hypothetical protein
MILRGKGRFIGGVMVALVIAAACAGTVVEIQAVAGRQELKSTSLTNVRQQALELFPRGSRLEEAASHLATIGFDCQAMQHFLADTSAPTLLCASNGRGYPDYPAVNLTLVTRNGLIADIDVWNVMVRADGDPYAVDLSATGSIRAQPSSPDLGGASP